MWLSFFVYFGLGGEAPQIPELKQWNDFIRCSGKSRGFLCEISCGHFPWKLKMKICAKFRQNFAAFVADASLLQKFRQNFALGDFGQNCFIGCSIQKWVWTLSITIACRRNAPGFPANTLPAARPPPLLRDPPPLGFLIKTESSLPGASDSAFSSPKRKK